jgi:replicative DNA helicase Mcm
MDLHQGIINTENDETDIDLDLLRKYITYAKVNCAPRLSEEAGAVLKSFYIKDREEA